MKKLLVLLITAALVTVSMAGFVFAEGETGTWYLQSLKQDNMEMDADLIASMGLEVTLTMEDDGTAIMESDGETSTGTWNAEGQLLFDNKEYSFELTDGQLKVSQDGSSMVFGLDAPAVADTSLAPAVKDAQLSDYNGMWNATAYVMMSMPLPMMMMGTQITLAIEEGTVTCYETIYDQETKETNTTEYEFAGELAEDGSLYVDFAGENVFSTVYEGASGVILTLLEDGTVIGTIPELAAMMDSMTTMFTDSTDSSSGTSSGAEAAEDAEVPAEDATVAETAQDAEVPVEEAVAEEETVAAEDAEVPAEEEATVADETVATEGTDDAEGASSGDSTGYSSGDSASDSSGDSADSSSGSSMSMDMYLIFERAE